MTVSSGARNFVCVSLTLLLTAAAARSHSTSSQRRDNQIRNDTQLAMALNKKIEFGFIGILRQPSRQRTDRLWIFPSMSASILRSRPATSTSGRNPKEPKGSRKQVFIRRGGTDAVSEGGTDVPPVNHAQDAHATTKLHHYSPAPTSSPNQQGCGIENSNPRN
jgi:hypothetical protein